MGLAKKLIESLIALGVIPDDKKDAAATAATNLEAEETKTLPAVQQVTANQITPESIAQAAAAAAAEAVRPILAKLEQSEAANKAISDTLVKQQTDAEVARQSKLIADAVADGRITKEESTKWAGWLKDAPKIQEQVLSGLKPNPAVAAANTVADKTSGDKGEKKSTATTTSGQNGAPDRAALMESAATAFASK